MKAALTNGYMVFEQISSFGCWVWVIPIGRVDGKSFNNDGPLTFRKTDLQEFIKGDK